MTKLVTSVLAASVSILASGCGSSDAPPPAPAPLDPTFTNVAKEVINEKNCSGPLCHSLTAGGFQLGSKDALYSAFVNQPAKGAKCRVTGDAGPGFILVVPGKPEESLLYMKLAHTQPCGDSMPASGTTLSADKIELVHDWIQAGANID